MTHSAPLAASARHAMAVSRWVSLPPARNSRARRRYPSMGGVMTPKPLQHEGPERAVPHCERSATWPVGQHPYAKDEEGEGCELPLEVRRRVREVHARL